MGMAIQVVTDWCEDPQLWSTTAVASPGPWSSRTMESATLHVSGTVTAVEDNIATVSLKAMCADVSVLGKAIARVRVG